jgi:hypothetical protein
MNAPLHDTIRSLRCGEAQTWRNLRLVPLFGPSGELDLTTLDRAIEQGEARVTEIDESGSVPQLKVWNDGDLPILILDATELEGGKQNRMLNTTVLVPPHTAIRVPVSCIERGRWRRQSTTFRSLARTSPASMRAAKSMRVSASLKSGYSYDACQSAVWDEVDSTLHQARVPSGTSCLTDAMDQSDDEIGDCIEQIPCKKGQVGIASYIGDELIGVDVLGASKVFGELYRQVVSGYVMDVVLGTHRRGSKGTGMGTAPLSALEATLRCPLEEHPSPGWGKGLRISGTDADSGLAVEAAALTVDEGLVHLAVHPK